MDYEKFEKETKKTAPSPLEKIQRVTKRKRQNRILNILLVVFILIFLVSAGCLAWYYIGIHKNEKKTESAKKMILDEDDIQKKIGETPSDEVKIEVLPDGREQKFLIINGQMVLAKYADIYRKYPDFIGWLMIPGTNIDYPVMQTMGDEEYYLRRDIDGNYNTAGTLFLDTSGNASIPTDNNIIYGHNMKAGTMFHSLPDYADEDFYKEHKTFYFDTVFGEGTYEIIAAFRTEVQDEGAEGFRYYEFFQAENEEDFDSYVENVKKLTPYQIDTTATYGDKLVTLSTCSYHTDEGRFVVVGKRVY